MDEGGYTGGPGVPPEGFLGPYNSVTEWYAFWGLAKIFNNPPDPRQPSEGGIYSGGHPDWTYQKAWDGGRNSPGGSVIDFVVYNPGPGRMTTGIRIVTEYWHIYTTNAKQVIDQDQLTHLEQSFDMRDMWDQDFVNDPTGAATVITLKNLLGMLDRPNPIFLGTALRGSRMDRIGGLF